MTKNIYYRTVIQRNSMLKSQVQALSSWAVSYPRLVLEVFIRKNFGERYFFMPTAIIVFLILVLIPLGSSWAEIAYTRNFPLGILWGKFTLWYAFAGAFLYFSILRNREIAKNPSVYDFKKFSLYQGDINPVFVKFRKTEGEPDWRKIETMYEPAPFLAAGIILWLIGQPLGILLFVCGIMYSGGYSLAYLQGDHFIMDKIDEILMNEELEEVFVDGKDPKDARGVRFQGKKPIGEDMRRKVAEMFTEEETVVAR